MSNGVDRSPNHAGIIIVIVVIHARFLMKCPTNPFLHEAGQNPTREPYKSIPSKTRRHFHRPEPQGTRQHSLLSWPSSPDLYIPQLGSTNCDIKHSVRCLHAIFRTPFGMMISQKIPRKPTKPTPRLHDLPLPTPLTFPHNNTCSQEQAKEPPKKKNECVRNSK